MSTPDVPGANPANKDKLSRGCWAEHEDGSLIYVKDIDENERVIFEVYDLSNKDNPVYYPYALGKKDFEDKFSYDPKKVGTLNLKWTWHDRTPMPWDKVMKVIQSPVPVDADVHRTLSAAARVAESLRTVVAQVLTPDHIQAEQGIVQKPAGKVAKTIAERLRNAVRELVD
jgi:hypothetical protein